MKGVIAMKKYQISIKDKDNINLLVENIEALSEQQAINSVIELLAEKIKNTALVKEYTYDEKDRIIAVRQNNGFWIKQQFNDNDDIIYYENSRGYWQKYEYDNKGRVTLYENSNGFWEKSEYDDQGNCIYCENSDGFKRGTPRAELEQEPDITDD